MKNSLVKVISHNSNPGKAAISENENTVNSAIENAGENVTSLKWGGGVEWGYRIVWDLVKESSGALKSQNSLIQIFMD